MHKDLQNNAVQESCDPPILPRTQKTFRIKTIENKKGVFWLQPWAWWGVYKNRAKDSLFIKRIEINYVYGIYIQHTPYHQMCHNNFDRNTMEGSNDETNHHHMIMRKSQGHINI